MFGAGQFNPQIEKLVGEDNWKRWKRQITLLLKHRKVLDVVTGKMGLELSNRKSFETKDTLAQLLIISSLDPSIESLTASCSSSKEVWDTLESAFDLELNRGVDRLLDNFFSCTKLDAKNISTRVALIQSNFSALNAELQKDVGCPMPELMLMGRILSVLPTEYVEFKTYWTGLSLEERSLNEMLEKLRLAEIEHSEKNPESSKQIENVRKKNDENSDDDCGQSVDSGVQKCPGSEHQDEQSNQSQKKRNKQFFRSKTYRSNPNIRSAPSSNLSNGLNQDNSLQSPSEPQLCVHEEKLIKNALSKLGASFRVDKNCDICKTTKKNLVSAGPTSCGLWIHAELCRPFQEPSVAGSRYFLCLKDKFSQFRKVYYLTHVSEVAKHFEVYVEEAKNLGYTIQKVFCYGETEFMDGKMAEILEEHNITAARPKQNDDWKHGNNKMVVEAVKSMILSKHLPHELWADAVRIVIFILNRTELTEQESKTPCELWTGNKTKTILPKLKVFGSDCYTYEYTYIPEERKKLKVKIPCFFVGYDGDGALFRLRKKNGKKNIVSARSAFFDEDLSSQIIDNNCLPGSGGRGNRSDHQFNGGFPFRSAYKNVAYRSPYRKFGQKNMPGAKGMKKNKKKPHTNLSRNKIMALDDVSIDSRSLYSADWSRRFPDEDDDHYNARMMAIKHAKKMWGVNNLKSFSGVPDQALFVNLMQGLFSNRPQFSDEDIDDLSSQFGSHLSINPWSPSKQTNNTQSQNPCLFIKNPGNANPIVAFHANGQLVFSDIKAVQKMWDKLKKEFPTSNGSLEDYLGLQAETMADGTVKIQQKDSFA